MEKIGGDNTRHDKLKMCRGMRGRSENSSPQTSNNNACMQILTVCANEQLLSYEVGRARVI